MFKNFFYSSDKILNNNNKTVHGNKITGNFKKSDSLSNSVYSLVTIHPKMIFIQ